MADDNRPLKYARYAIGEIILVVIGILIALQINNWNEQRKAKVKEAALLLNLTQDLRSDSISFSRNFNILSDIISLHGKLYEIGVNNNIDIIIDNPNDILPWTGRYKDGFDNKITMHAYANPDTDSNGAGYGIIKFNKERKDVTFECWPRYEDVRLNNPKQFKGWPITVSLN